MSTIINATTTNGVVIQPDNSGSLVLQTNNGTTALTINTSQNVAFAKGFTVGATAAPAFSAYQSSVQTVSTSTWTKVQLQTEEFDTNSNFDSTTNYRFTPTVAGYYQVNAVVTVSNAASANQAGFYKNGSLFKYFGNSGTASQNTINGSALISCNGSTDYIEFYVNLSTGQALSGTGQTYVYFQGSMVRSA